MISTFSNSDLYSIDSHPHLQFRVESVSTDAVYFAKAFVYLLSLINMSTS